MFVVTKLQKTWWENIKDHYRNICKANKSGSGGESKSQKTITWHFYELLVPFCPLKTTPALTSMDPDGGTAAVAATAAEEGGKGVTSEQSLLLC